MIESEVIDARCGEPHVTPEQIADVNIGTYGADDYVLSTGNKIKAELITSNSVRVFDGVMIYGGIRDAIPVNKYYDVPISNGAQGKNRNDIIVRRYTREEGTSGKASAKFYVVKGTPVSGTAADPAIPVTDIRAGALTHDMPLHRVRLEGLNVVAVEPLYKVLYNADEMQDMVTELNRNRLLDYSKKEIWYLAEENSSHIVAKSGYLYYILRSVMSGSGVFSVKSALLNHFIILETGIAAGETYRSGCVRIEQGDTITVINRTNMLSVDILFVPFSE